MTRNQTVVIAVDTTEKFSHTAARNARLSSAATAAAKSVADSSFAHGQWGAGINAATGSMSTAATGPGVNTAPVAPAEAQSSFPWVGLITLLVIGGAIIAGLKALGRSRQRRGMTGPGNGYGPGAGGEPAGYGGGAGYGPGYGGAGGRGVGGMLADGALGGLGGGLLGYELGKQAGERRDGPDNGGYAEQDQGGFVESDQGDGGAD